MPWDNEACSILYGEHGGWGSGVQEFQAQPHWSEKPSPRQYHLSWYLKDEQEFNDLRFFTESYPGGKGFPGGSVVKNPPTNAGDVGFILGLGQGYPLEKWQPIPVFLPEKSHGQRSLEGYSAWGRKRGRHKLLTKQQQFWWPKELPSTSCLTVILLNWWAEERGEGRWKRWKEKLKNPVIKWYYQTHFIF